MTKEQLIRELEGILPIMKKVGVYMNEVDRLDMQIRNLKSRYSQPKGANLMDGIKGWGMGFLVTTIICGIFWNTLPISVLKVLYPLFLLLILIGMVAGTIIGLKKAKGSVKKEDAELLAQIEQYKQKRKASEDKWISILSPHWDRVKRIIPEAYASPLFVQTAYDYLTNGRADSMKECINLFEEEQHRNRMEQGIADMQAQYQAEIENMNNKVAELENRVRWAEHEASVANDIAHPF